MNVSLSSITALITLVWLTGCPDPNTEFSDFVTRHEDLYGNGSGSGGQVGVGGGCAVPAAGELDGEYLFSLVAKQSAAKPAPLNATLTTSDGAAGLEFSLAMQPINADDRMTTVGSPFNLGPFTVNDDGTFEADFGTLTIPPDTNPISGSELVADVVIRGALCPSEFFCGPADGTITSPVMLDINGSAWTMESYDTFMEPPKVNCAGDLADPL